MPNSAIGTGHLAPSLTRDEQLQVCRWLGEFIPPARIPALIATQFGKRVEHQYGYEMLTRKKWQPLIDRHRQDWLVKVLEVPLANKKVRLQELQRLWENATRPNANPDKQEQRILRILEKARLEMEDKKSEQTNYFFGQFNYANASDEELLQRRAELVKRIQAFRWPTTRRLTDGMGRSEGRETPTSTDSEDHGGNGEVGHVALDFSPARGMGGVDGSPNGTGAGVSEDSADGVSDACDERETTAIDGDCGAPSRTALCEESGGGEDVQEPAPRLRLDEGNGTPHTEGQPHDAEVSVNGEAVDFKSNQAPRSLAQVAGRPAGSEDSRQEALGGSEQGGNDWA